MILVLIMKYIVQMIMLLLIVKKINHFLDGQLTLKTMDHNNPMFILRLIKSKT
ncbi:hypothetical protein GLOIN_2v1512406 [Rhizophagus irregularis DAOM 181602=DAOM 197198]|uniref:Uncharacterized protein n=1 Tax=Rhizophagus irregularis (strain DAOM 181602 / DAOM 197198 / MUCL 43194) TaxID=747089 RepID=A0A2P4QSZ4_RHIID|nr:hypothetical protein GLOIN_2v1512406 [Rhizophagus irregularis DAOM 181602=DAOM 197198]POG80745.1 hypothetical protein GLOIN_2v1512406 [Rhizophagus irregularis DAOM 181602=DAOM 197198]|eukprot:XP_025187611.1 hypothetical protein GLOIN_2v1512406 [Rhizophagus irregularis DAOM 181602=DAOM 197198]